MKPGVLAVVCAVCGIVGLLIGYSLRPVAEPAMQVEPKTEAASSGPEPLADAVETIATGPRNVEEIGALHVALGVADRSEVLAELGTAAGISDPGARLDTMTVAYRRLAEIDPSEALQHALRNGGATNSPWAQEWIRRIFD